MFFLYGLLVLPRGPVEVLANGQWQLSGLINGGGLDRLLVSRLWQRGLARYQGAGH